MAFDEFTMTLSKEDYEQRKADHLCIQCGEKMSDPRPDRVRCQTCLDKNKVVRQVRRQKRLKEGKCTECVEQAKPGHSMCQKCIDERTERSQENYHKRKEAGTCRLCGADSGGESRCAKHKQAFQEWRESRKQGRKDKHA